MDSILSVQNQNFSGDSKELTKVLGADVETKSRFHWQFPLIWQSLWRSILESFILRQHLTVQKQMGLNDRIKEGISAVLSHSGLDEKWWADSMECYCNLRNIQDLLSDGKTPYERRFGEPFEGPVIPFGAKVEYYPILHEASQGFTSLARKFCQEYSSVMYFSRRKSGKETLWSQTLRIWKRWTHLKSMVGDSMQRKCWRPKNGEQFIFPIADGKVKLSGGDQVLRTSTLIRDRPERGEEQENLLGESDGSSRTSFQVASPDDGEARNDFWSISGHYMYVITSNPESNFTRREKNHSQCHYNTLTWYDLGCIAGAPHWRLLEHRRGPRSIGCVDRIHTNHHIGRKTSKWVYMVWGTVDEKQTTSRPDYLWPERWKDMLEAAQRKEKHKWTEAWQSQKIARCLLYWSSGCRVQRNDLKSAEKVGSSVASTNALQDQGKNVQGNLSHSWCSQDKIRMHRWSQRICEKAFGRNSTQRSWRPHCRWRNQFIEQLISCPQVYSYAQSNESTRCEKNRKNRENTRVAADESQKEERCDRWSKERRQNRALRVIDGHLSSEEVGVGTKISKTQRPSCTPRWHCKRWFWLLCSIHRARFICVTNDGRKSNGCHSKATRMRRTSSRRSISLYPGQNGRSTIVIENSKVRVSRFWDTSTEAQMAQIMVLYGRSSCSSWKDSVRSYFTRSTMGKAIWESSIRTRLGKVLNWECLFVHWEKGLFLSVYVDDIKLAGKKQNIDPMWKLLNKEVDLGEPTSFLDNVYSVWLHSTRLRNKQRYCGQLQSHVWIQNFRRSNRKITVLWKSAYLFVVLRHGGSCQEMCGTILRASEQNNKANIQSYNSMPWWPSIQRSIGIGWRIVKSLLTDCSEMLVFGTHWQARHSVVSKHTCTSSHQSGQENVTTLLARLISYIHLTCEHRQKCFVGNSAHQCRLGKFQDSDFAGDLEDSQSTSVNFVHVGTS